MPDAKVSALAAAGALGTTELLYIVQGGVSKKVTLAQLQTLIGAPITGHIAETDPIVHNADKIASASSVAQGNVEDDLSHLNLMKADGAAVAQKTDALSEMFGGLPFGTIAGQGTRNYYQDDFRWSTAVGTSGQIGETSNLRTGGATVLGTGNASRPGVVQLQTTSTTNTYSVLYTKEPMFSMGAFFEAHWWFRPVSIDANTHLRVGLCDSTINVDPDLGVPWVNAVYIEKLAGDTSFWRLVTNIASTKTRVTSAEATSANQYVHLWMWRSSATQVSFRFKTSVAGIPPTSWSTEEIVTFAPGNILGNLFVQAKSTAAASKSVDVDRWQSLVYDLNR